MPRFLHWIIARWWMLALGVVVCIIATVVISQNFQPEPVLAYKVAYQDVLATTTVTGEVNARTTVEVSSPLNARITDIMVDDGDVIKKGQVLVTLDEQDLAASAAESQARLAEAEAALRVVRQGTRSEDIARYQAALQENKNNVQQSQALYAQSQAKLADAQKKAQRMTQLYKEEVLSTQEYEQAITERDVAQQESQRLQADIRATQFRQKQASEQLRLAQNGPTQAEIAQASASKNAAANAAKAASERLGDRVIRSTLNGVVLKRLHDPGEMAIPGQGIIKVADWNTIEIQGFVEEADLSRINVGDFAYVILDADPEKPLPAQITKIGAQVNPENGTVEIRVQLRPEAKAKSVKLLPGMTTDINIITQRLKHALVVPATAVTKENNKSMVYVFEDNKLVQRSVTLERISMQYFRIISGLQPGDWVARFGNVKLLEKKNVSPKETDLENSTSKKSAPKTPTTR